MGNVRRGDAAERQGPPSLAAYCSAVRIRYALAITLMVLFISAPFAGWLLFVHEVQEHPCAMIPGPQSDCGSK